MGVEQGCNQVFGDFFAHFEVVGASVSGPGNGEIWVQQRLPMRADTSDWPIYFFFYQSNRESTMGLWLSTVGVGVEACWGWMARETRGMGTLSEEVEGVILERRRLELFRKEDVWLDLAHAG